jgi:hypothetical protein
MAWITVLTSSVNRVIVNNKTIMTTNKQDQYIKSMGMCLEILNILLCVVQLHLILRYIYQIKWGMSSDEIRSI